jgi:hypothetical protein
MLPLLPVGPEGPGAADEADQTGKPDEIRDDEEMAVILRSSLDLDPLPGGGPESGDP